MGAIFGLTRFSLVRISVRDLVEDGKSLVRSSGVGGGGQNLILIICELDLPHIGVLCLQALGLVQDSERRKTFFVRSVVAFKNLISWFLFRTVCNRAGPI